MGAGALLLRKVIAERGFMHYSDSGQKRIRRVDLANQLSLI